MKYHYLSGVRKSLREAYCNYIWWAVTIFIIVFAYDILFNYSRWFTDIIVWTWK